MGFIANPCVTEKFERYPEHMRDKVLFLRELIIETASGMGNINLEETLKWGEPSYVTNTGSTIRIDWKKKNPDQYSMYFNCRTTLVDTFKELYPNQFQFEGNREIIFQGQNKVPINELKHCVSLALDYHQIKHLPMLGA